MLSVEEIDWCDFKQRTKKDRLRLWLKLYPDFKKY